MRRSLDPCLLQPIAIAGNPMLILARLLAARGLLVTFVVTEEWLGFLTPTSPALPPNLRLRLIPNVIPSEVGRAKDFSGFLEAVYTKMEAPFVRLLDQLDPPPTAIVADTYLPWAVAVAGRRGVPLCSLFTMSAAFFARLYHFERLIAAGHDKVQKGGSASSFSLFFPPLSFSLLSLPSPMDSVDNAGSPVAGPAVAFEFPAGESPVKLPRRIRRRLLESSQSSTAHSSVEEIEAKLKEADQRRQSVWVWQVAFVFLRLYSRNTMGNSKKKRNKGSSSSTPRTTDAATVSSTATADISSATAGTSSATAATSSATAATSSASAAAATTAAAASSPVPSEVRDDLRAAARKSTTALTLGDEEQAMKLMDKACLKHKTHPCAHVTLSHVYFVLAGSVEDSARKLSLVKIAADAVAKAASLEPSNPHYQRLRASALCDIAKFTGDAAVYDQVIEVCDLMLALPITKFADPNENLGIMSQLTTSESLIRRCLQLLGFIRDNSIYCKNHNLGEPLQVSSSTKAKPRCNRQQSEQTADFDQQKNKALGYLISLINKDRLGLNLHSLSIAMLLKDAKLEKLDPLLLESLCVIAGGHPTKGYPCCYCHVVPHATANEHIAHILEEHIGDFVQRLKTVMPDKSDKELEAALPEKASSDWIQRSIASGWTPLDDPSVESNPSQVTDIAERRKLLHKIEVLFEKLVNYEILSVRILDFVIEMTMKVILGLPSSSELLISGVTDSNRCIHLMKSGQLKNILTLLELLFEPCESDEIIEQETSVDIIPYQGIQETPLLFLDHKWLILDFGVDNPRFMRGKTIGLIIAGIAAGAKDPLKERIKELLLSWWNKRKQRYPEKEEDDEDQLPPASLPTCSSNVNYPPWYLSVPPASSRPEEENVAILFPFISTPVDVDLDNPHCTILSNPTSDDHIAAGHEREDSFLLVHKNNAFSVEEQELASGDEHQELASGNDKYQLDTGDKPQELVGETNAAYSEEETPEPPFQLYETSRVTAISRAHLGLFVCVDGVLVDRPDFYTDHSIVVHGLRSNATRCSSQLENQAKDVLFDAAMYARCGDLVTAKDLFDEMSEIDVVLWSSMISGYASKEMWKEAFKVFERFQRASGEVTLVAWNAIAGVEIQMCRYKEVSRCKVMQQAYLLFWMVGMQSVFTWYLMMEGFAISDMAKM